MAPQSGAATFAGLLMTATTPSAPKAVEAIEDADAAIADKVEPFGDTAPARAIAFVSKVGDQPPMRILCAATVAAGLITGNPRLAGAGVRMLAAHTIATAAKDFVKERIDRVRPDARRNGEDHRMRPGTSEEHDKTSFPSGHSAGAMAVGAAAARAFPEHRVAALGAGGAIALAQVPRRSHYLSDVVVGSAIGLISEAILARFTRGPGFRW